MKLSDEWGWWCSISHWGMFWIPAYYLDVK